MPKFSAVRTAKGFAATHCVKLSERQYIAFVSALARSYVDIYNKGYLAAQEDAKNEVPTTERNGGS